MPAAFIDDGYTCAGHLAEEPGLYEAVDVMYRPLTRREDAAYQAYVLNCGDGEKGVIAAEQRAAELVASHLVSWSIVDGKQRPVPITAANIGRLQPVLGGRLLSLIRGTRPSDKQPDGSQPDHPGDESLGNSPRG